MVIIQWMINGCKNYQELYAAIKEQKTWEKNWSRKSKIFTLYIPSKILFSTRLDQLSWLEPPTSKHSTINMPNLYPEGVKCHLEGRIQPAECLMQLKVHLGHAAVTRFAFPPSLSTLLSLTASPLGKPGILEGAHINEASRQSSIKAFQHPPLLGFGTGTVFTMFYTVSIFPTRISAASPPGL